MILEALQDRLKILEDEILHLTDLASRTSDHEQQDAYNHLAEDLQREARALRREIKRS